MASEELSIDTIWHDPILLLPPHIISTAEFGESPLPANNDLLTTRELELCTSKGLLCVMTVAVLATHREQDLTDCNPSTSSLWLPKGTPHSSLEPISPSARKHLVDTQDMERMHPHSQMEGILTRKLRHVLVAGDTGSFQSLTRDILLLPTHKVDTERELINTLLLHPNIVNSDLGIRNTATIP